MTVIMGLVDEESKCVYIGGDSQGSAEYDAHLRKDTKVFFVDNKQFLIGCAGSYRTSQLLRFSFKPPKQSIGKDVYEYMCTDFIDEVRKCLAKGGVLKVIDDIEETEDSQFLVAYKGRLFSVDIDFQVGEYFTNYAACGIARDFALGSLYSTVKKSSTHKIALALNAAEEFSASVRRPFVIEKLEY